MTALVEARSTWKHHEREAARIRSARSTMMPGTDAYERMSKLLVSALYHATKWRGVVHELEVNSRGTRFKGA